MSSWLVRGVCNLTYSYFLGVDGGGSKCKARLEDAVGNVLGEYTSGPANPMRDYDLAIHSIQTAIDGVYSVAKLSLEQAAKTSATMGLAGLNIPCCLAKMNNWKHPFASMLLTTDLHIACMGAHGKPKGAIVIIGTGSSGIVCKGEQQIEYGGHGFTLGDKGSGAWFGAQAIRYSLETIGGVRTPTAFTEKLFKSLDNPSAYDIVERFANASPAEFAHLSPLVFESAESNDPIAVEIVEQGALYIEQMCTQILLEKPKGLSLIGGLSHVLLPWLSADLQAKLNPPLDSPEVGAILIARQQQIAPQKYA